MAATAQRVWVMCLTLWTDYALRTLMYVGANEGRLATIAEIAATFAVSKAHLMKVVNKLARLGYLETVRGKSGGVRLGRSPQEIGVGAVVRDTEEELAVMGCLSDSGFCRLDGCCVLKRALREATLAFLATLDRYTLADLLAPKAALAYRLGLAPDGEARGAAL
jgi:Rrf2 family transcriptional regulator, nitric oxide-sensitive transcriptional repressor